jgi:beta-barrel assembly-enhancing protease
MKKVIIQGVITIVVFFGAWFALSQIDWVRIFKVQKITNRTEEKLGDLFWEIFQKSEKENQNPLLLSSLDSMVTKICSANKIERKQIKVHILDRDEINAFALPNGHLIVYTGLILESDNPEELSGVICHELAHIQLNHVMKKLVKEVGISVLVSMTTGNSGSQIIKEAAKLLSSSAFDRSLEKDADIKAVDFLVRANINPEPFANFLYRISDKKNETTNYLTWISTHPEPKERAEYIVGYSIDKEIAWEPVLYMETWKQLKEILQ